MTIRPRRSVLYMPGSNARALEKAKTIAADCLILDLEDAVAPEAKADARMAVRDAVRAGGYGHREVVIRINALSSPWGTEDLMAALAARPDAVLVPKVSTAADIEQVESAMGSADAADEIALWAMMETPLAMLNLQEIAATAGAANGRLTAFVMGTNDLAKETGAALSAGREAMLAWLSMSIAAARAYGLAIVDGVFNDFRNEDGFRAECAHGRLLGMDGKTLIHPSQVGPCNEIFSPSADDIEWANKIIAAFALPENQNKGAITIDGRMVELLHAEIAQRTVQIAEAIDQAGEAAGQ